MRKRILVVMVVLAALMAVGDAAMAGGGPVPMRCIAKWCEV